MPVLITFSTGNTIEFLYDAAGTKLRKTTKVGTTVQYIQDYLPNGIEYRQTGTGPKRVESVYHAEGRYYNTNVDASNTIAWRKEYSFKDYLGNTRLAFTDRDANGVVDITGTASTSDILQENHYYGFGLAFEGAWLQNDAGARDNQYMYNGKELHSDFGLNMYAYGARYYDPVIGRFTGVDPIADEFPFVTTFNYAENEPIANIDLHGLQKFSFKELAGRTAIFVAGTANAISSNLAGGAGRGNPNDFGSYANSARNGAAVGDAITIVLGTAGGIGAGAAILLEGAGGVTAPAIAPTLAFGALSLNAAYTGATNLVKASGKEGGSYNDLDVNTGKEERHHIPSNASSPLSKGKGPSIKMDKTDHQMTSSWGSSKSAQNYRAKQKELIDKGKFEEAQKMDINDVRKKFGSKYDEAIKQARQYTKELKDNKDIQ